MAWELNKHGQKIWIDKRVELADQYSKERARNHKARTLRIFDLLKQGYSVSQIKEEIKQFEDITDEAIKKNLKKAYKLVDSYVDKEINHLVSLHNQRYEEIYAENIKTLDELWETDPEVFYKIGALKMNEILQSLVQKEKIAGLYRKKSNEKTIHDVQKIYQNKEKPSVYDLKNLSFEEKKKLKDHLFKSKIDKEDGIQPTIIKESIISKKEIEEATEDDDVLQLPESSIENIKIENIKIEEIPDPEEENKGKNLLDLYKILQKTQEEEFKKILKTKKQ